MRHHHHNIDWGSLHLSNTQSQTIGFYQADWRKKYGSVMPEIRFQQQHLQDLFHNPKSDPLDIVSTQQSITRLQEELRNDAMTNYLHKRAVLNDLQQRELEAQLHQMVLERQQRPPYQQVGTNEQAGLGGIMDKIRWAIGAH